MIVTLQKVSIEGICACVLSLFRLVQLFVTLWTVACQALVHGILQARILEWAAISFSRGPSQPKGRNWVSCIADRFFTTVPPGKPIVISN